MTATDTNTWILGLDLGERSRGAVRFAHWLAGPDHTVAIHVLEQWSRPYIRNDAITAVRDNVQRLSRELHVAAPATTSILEAASAEEGLAHAAEGAAGLIIGRAASVGEDVALRLGHVARHLLRRLPGPVVVVPRDLPAVGPGPILLATDLDAPTNAALAFARDLAAKHQRELVLVHVGDTRASDLIDDLDPHWQAARDAYRDEVARSFEQWAARHELLACRRHLAYGSIVEELQALAIASQAALIVVGSRRLGSVGRLFLGSSASALAGIAVCPVAVIPPT
ncbi:universal stress protein [Nannocystis sp.]|uniref:universal stress protein n=1 Tax=Nannocystis sp. TaxID=1962667 RepID=UPI0024247CED|nr:universal stress protein [Nannocystis sp.]MBK7829047.1 universal stress protein [Nannocystis sp.]MBK9757558.1 universal stress protein [Nannocystis sp.]